MKSKNDILIENNRLFLERNQLKMKNLNYTRSDKKQYNAAQKRQKVKIAGDGTTGTGTTDFHETGNHSRNSNNQLSQSSSSHVAQVDENTDTNVNLSNVKRKTVADSPTSPVNTGYTDGNGAPLSHSDFLEKYSNISNSQEETQPWQEVKRKKPKNASFNRKKTEIVCDGSKPSNKTCHFQEASKRRWLYVGKIVKI
ncbi:hypothetical protein HHI36_002691 [Cryptolaemus montrouzieri]|uniref:Uncharacterized protein n=1 Tax=Cryptolaemus montrouzieri TaxID=559131 RepID=A0ABD2PBT1_9CUCU